MLIFTENLDTLQMKIGIMGTRGIPNRYGGFEQLTEYLSKGLTKKGHDVFVYNSSLHPYKEKQWNGVNIIHCKDWKNKIGTAGQFFYDRNCINDARQRDLNVLLHLGYTSDSIWHKRWPKNMIHIVNMDGLEWKRAKYSKPVKIFLKWAEKLAAKNSDVLIADSLGIQEYLLRKYNKSSSYIPYGATVFIDPNPEMLDKFNLHPKEYFLMIARMEPENNIELVIKGYNASEKKYPMVIVGDTTNNYGKYLQKKYSKNNIIFPGSVFESEPVNNLRYFSSIYFHGHSVGGTNPSLLEAMACQCRIAAHKNNFNEYVLGNDSEYFSSIEDVTNIIAASSSAEIMEQQRKLNLEKINTIYNWPKIIDRYEEVMLNSLR